MRSLPTAVAGTALLLVVAAACTSGPATVAAASRIPAAAPPSSAAAPRILVPTDRAAGTTAQRTAAPRTTAPSTTAPRTTAPRTTAPRTTRPPARASAPPRTPTPAAVPSADADTPGPDDGPPCAADRQYSDEAPTGLRPDVLTAWVALQKYARSQRVPLCLNDGKRSAAQQLALYDDYVKQFGKAAADAYVLTPATSAHVKGYAVDVQPAKAYQWLQNTRGTQGWCRIYDNEPWHFEYSPTYRTAGCPARLPRPVR